VKKVQRNPYSRYLEELAESFQREHSREEPEPDSRLATPEKKLYFLLLR